MPAEFINLLRTERTYATYENAEKALKKACGNWDGRVPYFIAATPDGRFAPVAIGISLLPLIHAGVTVAG